MIEGLRDWNEYVRLLVGLLALINPLTVLPIFLGFVQGRSAAEKAHISTVAALTVLVTLLIFTYLGSALLDLFAITIESFRIAGGILLLLTALEMMRAKSPTGERQAEGETSLTSIGQQVAVLIVGGFVGPAGAGLYRLANQLANSLTKISSLLSRSIFVELSRTSSHGREALGALFRRTNRLALVVGAVIIGLILMIGHPLLGLIAGREFLPAYPLLLMLGVAACIDLIGVSYRPLLMATDRAGLSLRISFVSTLLLLGLQSALLPLYGTQGAAMANIAASLAGFTMMGLASRRAVTSGG